MSAWVALVLAARLGVTGAAATERWVCIYPGYPDAKPVSVSFDLLGDKLIQDGLWPYQVVHNADDALIATYPRVGTVEGRRAVDARTIVIDRGTGDMTISNIDLWPALAGENLPENGHCAPRE